MFVMFVLYCLPEHVNPSKPLLHAYTHFLNPSVQIAFSGHPPGSLHSFISRNSHNVIKKPALIYSS